MRLAKFTISLVLLGTLLLSGCASYNYWEGKRMIDTKKYDQAINKLRLAEVESPQDYKPKRELGITFFYLQKYKPALEKLLEAKRFNLKDPATVYFLARTYESLAQYDAALAEYMYCNDLSAPRQIKVLVNRQIQKLLLKKVSLEVKAAVQQEQSLDLIEIPENSVAVLYFKNITLWERLTPLEKGLAQMLITDLSKVRALQLVERLKLAQLIQEIQLSNTDLFAKETSPRLGKLLGARKLVKGGFISNEEGEIHIIATVVESGTGEPLAKEIHVQGGLFEFFKLEKELALNLVENMGIDLSYSEIEAIKETPTKNFLAYLAYLEGVDFQDKGQLEDARRSYKKAVELDPKFRDAQERLETTTETGVSEQALTQLIVSAETRHVQDRLVTTAQNNIQGSLPVTNEETTVFRPRGMGTVVITGQLPQPTAARR